MKGAIFMVPRHNLSGDLIFLLHFGPLGQGVLSLVVPTVWLLWYNQIEVIIMVRINCCNAEPVFLTLCGYAS